MGQKAYPTEDRNPDRKYRLEPIKEAALVQHPVIRGTRERIFSTPRRWKRVVMILLASTLLLIAIWASYALRLSNWSPAITPGRLTLAFLEVAVTIPVFIRLGLYRSVISYLPTAATWTILRAMMIATVLSCTQYCAFYNRLSRGGPRIHPTGQS